MAGVIDDPAAKRLAMALPIEGDRWLVLFGGVHGEVAPTDDEQRLAYASTLPAPVIADILEVCRAARRAGHPPVPVQPTTPRRTAEAVPARLGAAR